MAALVDTEDLAAFLKVDVGSLNAATAALMLELASDAVRDELRQVIDYVDDDTVELQARGGDVLLLPELPAWEVTSVRIEGHDGTFGDVLDPGDDYRFEAGDDGRLGILRRKGAHWPHDRTVEVHYAHGYGTPGDTGVSVAPLPGTIRLAVLRVAARGYENPTGKRQRTMGRYSETDGASTPGIYLTAADKVDLEPYYAGAPAGARA